MPPSRSRAQFIAIGSLASLAAMSFAVFITGATLADVAFFFQRGREIEVVGNITACIPTHMLQICYTGFRDTYGNYYWLENLPEIYEANPGMAQGITSGDERSSRFRIWGTFSHGDPSHSDADVAGSIKVKSMVRTGDGTHVAVPGQASR